MVPWCIDDKLKLLKDLIRLRPMCWVSLADANKKEFTERISVFLEKDSNGKFSNTHKIEFGPFWNKECAHYTLIFENITDKTYCDHGLANRVGPRQTYNGDSIHINIKGLQLNWNPNHE